MRGSTDKQRIVTSSQTSTRMRSIMGMMRSHSSMACSRLEPRVQCFVRATYRFVQLDLPIGQVREHLLHLGFLSILEDGLLPQRLVAERVTGLVSRCNRLLQLKE